MSEMYTGWDGKPYPWPPPEGWYEASDGRWWAPGTGPNPPPATPQTSSPDSVPGPTGAAARTAQMPPYEPPTEAMDPARTVTGDLDPDPLGHTTTAGGPPPDDWNGPNSVDTGVPDLSNRPPKRGRAGIVLALIGALAALALAAGAFVILRADDDSTAADDDAIGTETTDGEGTDTTIEGSDDGDGSTTESTDGDDTTTTEAETTTTSEAETTTTTEAETTTTTEAETTTTANEAAQVAQFRQILADNDLTSDGLSDADITTFGTTFCIFAVASETEDEYEEFRTEAISETESELSDEELFLVIDAAVVVFCPDAAERLGINV